MESYNAGLLLNGDDPTNPVQFIVGYSPADRDLEIIRLGSAVPAGAAGYVTQISAGSRRVRLDAMRQLQRLGIEFTCDVHKIED